MRALIGALLPILDAVDAVALVRVIHSSGSAPRGAGAAMLVGEGGLLFGTVGGGAVEHEAMQLAADVLASGSATVRDFSLRNSEAADLGMVCGGDMRLLFQRIEPCQAAFFRDALSMIGNREVGSLDVDVNTGEMKIVREGETRPGHFCQPLFPLGRTYVFGAGHVARALVPLLSSVGFHVTVMDDRAAFADAMLFPDADEVRVVDFAQLDDIAPTEQDDVIIMTRGHEHDLSVLSQMLKSPARYVGMMGSRHKRNFVYAHLRERGYVDAAIARVHSPIGLAIGAETPQEIAVSIVAELIGVRAG